MDALSGLLDGVRARGAFVLRLSLDPPWSMLVRDEAPLALICLTAGSAVLIGADGQGHRMGPGDVALARCGGGGGATGGDRYVFADSPATTPQVVIHPGNRCTTLGGKDLRMAMTVGVRTWGNAAAGTDQAIVCAYQGHSAVSARLLDALPPLLVLRAGQWHTPLVELLGTEARHDGPGQEAYLDRLLDLVLMDVLRTWFDRAADAPRWWHAERDPLVGPALRLIHDDPAHPWTVAELAGAVGHSRAAFARRFAERVGESPIAFLTGWRLAVAADLLRSDDGTLSSIARRVGYATPFALSSAFKRAHGTSPAAYRVAMRAEATAAG